MIINFSVLYNCDWIWEVSFHTHDGKVDFTIIIVVNPLTFHAIIGTKDSMVCFTEACFSAQCGINHHLCSYILWYLQHSGALFKAMLVMKVFYLWPATLWLVTTPM